MGCYKIRKKTGDTENDASRKKRKILALPPAALPASGSRVEGLPSSQPVTQAPLLLCVYNCSANLHPCQDLI